MSPPPLAVSLDRARSAGLNLTSLWVLLCVDSGQTVQSDIHRSMGISCAAVGQIADILQRSGHLVRIRPERHARTDQRKVTLSLTDSGKQLLTSVLKP